MTKTSNDNNLNYTNFLKHFLNILLKNKVQRPNTPHFKGFAMMNLLLHTVFVATFSHL